MKAIRHTGIVVRDLDRSMRFYRDLLGFKVAEEKEEAGGYIDNIFGAKNLRITTVKMAAEDGNLIELVYCHSHSASPVDKKDLRNPGISHIAFTVGDMDAEFDRLTKNNVQFSSRPQVSPNGYAKIAFFQDPDGNFIEIVEVLDKNGQ